jgi:hypothetical protein
MRTALTLALIAVVGLGSLLLGISIGEEKAMSRVYELRTYTTLEGRLPALEKRFKDHTLKLFEKHGMRNGMYWKPTDPKLKDNTLIYVVSHESREAAEKSWNAFRNDPEWIKVRDASEADGKIVSNVQSVYMELADWSPVK